MRHALYFCDVLCRQFERVFDHIPACSTCCAQPIHKSVYSFQPRLLLIHRLRGMQAWMAWEEKSAPRTLNRRARYGRRLLRLRVQHKICKVTQVTEHMSIVVNSNCSSEACLDESIRSHFASAEKLSSSVAVKQVRYIDKLRFCALKCMNTGCLNLPRICPFLAIFVLLNYVKLNCSCGI